MFISEKLVFVELHKTGCTHIGKLLADLIKGQQMGKHNPPPPRLINSGRHFLGSVRNPWDWYVSLWAYGCDKKGLVYHLTAQTPKHSNKWKRCYKSSDDAGAFREWLHMMHSKDYWNDFGEGYGQSGISEIVGLMTYRYINLFCYHRAVSVSTLDDVILYEKQNCFINHYIRMENLEGDFISVMKKCGIKMNKNKQQKIRAMKKTNSSSGRKEASYYYDDETTEIINSRESIIIDKFKYPPV